MSGSIKAAAAAAATRVAGAGQKVAMTTEQWIAKIQEMLDSERATMMLRYPKTLSADRRWYDTFKAAVPQFVADIQRAGMTMDQFFKAKGLTYITLEMDMYLDQTSEYVGGLRDLAADVVRLSKIVGW